jgi:5-bromo-4-chloroindolyl phosphate hydrolysis protein
MIGVPKPVDLPVPTLDAPGSAYMKSTLRRGLVRATLIKPAVLFLLPLPLLLAAVAGLVSGDVERLGLAGGALVSFWGAGALALRGLADEVRYRFGERLDAPVIPLKQLSALPTTLGSGLAAAAAGHELAATVVFAALAGAGHLLFFGRDPRRQRIQVTEVDGIDRNAVTLQLKQAYGQVRGIESAARTIAVPEFCDRLSRITKTARAVLGEIERDPADAARARRFLNLYLDSAMRVTVDYARTHARERNQPLEQNFRQLLIEMEGTFEEQHRRLIEHEQLLLDADIEVLNARLTREGPG